MRTLKIELENYLMGENLGEITLPVDEKGYEELCKRFQQDDPRDDWFPTWWYDDTGSAYNSVDETAYIVDKAVKEEFLRNLNNINEFLKEINTFHDKMFHDFYAFCGAMDVKEAMFRVKKTYEGYGEYSAYVLENSDYRYSDSKDCLVFIGEICKNWKNELYIEKNFYDDYEFEPKFNISCYVQQQSNKLKIIKFDNLLPVEEIDEELNKFTSEEKQILLSPIDYGLSHIETDSIRMRDTFNILRSVNKSFNIKELNRFMLVVSRLDDELYENFEICASVYHDPEEALYRVLNEEYSFLYYGEYSFSETVYKYIEHIEAVPENFDPWYKPKGEYMK